MTSKGSTLALMFALRLRFNSSPCLVYTFFAQGGQYWRFEDIISNRYQCKIQSYVAHGINIPYNRSPLISSHKGGLKAGRSNSMSGNSFDQLLDQNEDRTSTIDLLAIGHHVELEPVLYNLLQAAGLDRVKQLLIQLTPSTADPGKALSQIRIIQMLKNRGFKKWSSHSHPPNFGKGKPGTAYRLSFLNVKFLG